MPAFQTKWKLKGFFLFIYFKCILHKRFASDTSFPHLFVSASLSLRAVIELRNPGGFETVQVLLRRSKHRKTFRAKRSEFKSYQPPSTKSGSVPAKGVPLFR